MRIFGVEREFPYYLTKAGIDVVRLNTALSNIIGKENDVNLRNELAAKSFFFLHGLTQSEYSKEAWGKINRNCILHDKTKELVGEIDTLVKGSYGGWEQENLAVQKVVKKLDIDDCRELLTIAKEYARAMGQLAETKYKHQEKVPNLDSFFETVSDPANNQVGMTFLADVAVHWRNQFLADNIKEICKKAGQEQKPVVVWIGAFHAEELKEILQADPFFANTKIDLPGMDPKDL
ncbi:MAG: hypothetical protein IT291_02785 [Deltaproteobacteria bacterium]|nr:hypothetical protein [Deltaproteobacteria bacterium]